ncbi:MAG: hypothetical protein HUJ26_14305 [Planctomycetaceae bacterium]|nr:hypothetical protein [Planctomycetaceae bacterium]
MTELTARQIINSLSVDQIDEEIDALEDELKGLKELRRVAAKREGKSASGSRGKSSSSKLPPEEVINLVQSALAAGPLTLQEIVDSSGVSNGQLRPTISKIPGVEKVDGLWTLTEPPQSDDD